MELEHLKNKLLLIYLDGGMSEESYKELQTIADTIPDLQLHKTSVSGSLNIEFADWDYTCGDGCCYTYGMDIYLNGEKLDEQNAEDSKNALKVVLEKLGYNVEINYR